MIINFILWTITSSKVEHDQILQGGLFFWKHPKWQWCWALKALKNLLSKTLKNKPRMQGEYIIRWKSYEDDGNEKRKEQGKAALSLIHSVFPLNSLLNRENRNKLRLSFSDRNLQLWTWCLNAGPFLHGSSRELASVHDFRCHRLPWTTSKQSHIHDSRWQVMKSNKRRESSDFLHNYRPLCTVWPGL